MRYFIFTILLVVPLLLTAQSKKEQIATLNLRVDSLSDVLVNVRVNNAQTLSDKSEKIFQLSQENVALGNERDSMMYILKEQIATLKLRVDSLSDVLVNERINNEQTLSDNSDKIFQLSQEKSGLEKVNLEFEIERINNAQTMSDKSEKIFQLSQEKSDLEIEAVRLVHLLKEKNKIQEDNDSLTLEIDSLTQLILALEQSKSSSRLSPNHIGYGSMGTYFDFQFDYFTNGDLDFNPVNIIPVGWSEDGMFCYITDWCDGGCGCCRLTITIYDVASNTIAKIQDFDVNDEFWKPPSSPGQLNDLCKEYSIIPTGIGVFQLPFETNKYYTELNTRESDYFQLEVVREKLSWRIVASGETMPTTVLLSDDFYIDDWYQQSPHDIKVAGLIRNPLGDHAVVVAFMMVLGFEAEKVWYMDLAPLPK